MATASQVKTWGTGQNLLISPLNQKLKCLWSWREDIVDIGCFAMCVGFPWSMHIGARGKRVEEELLKLCNRLCPLLWQLFLHSYVPIPKLGQARRQQSHLCSVCLLGFGKTPFQVLELPFSSVSQYFVSWERAPWPVDDMKSMETCWDVQGGWGAHYPAGLSGRILEKIGRGNQWWESLPTRNRKKIQQEW